ncbi:hypothetical protein [Micromonospora sp. NPDC005305]|uniref:hypothetical protein n=1 Tax=Micromonospora sp. NPDC005305 TaxID=3156875 RepID=UPI0033AD5096
MIGTVQILAIGYKQSRLPKAIEQQVSLLKSSPAVRLIDVYAIAKGKNRVLTEHGIEAFGKFDGEAIRQLLRSSGAARVISSYTVDSSGFLVQGTPIPDLKESIPPGTNAVILLIEHLWARPLEDAMRNGDAFPLAGGWAGRDALSDAGLGINEPDVFTPES